MRLRYILVLLKSEWNCNAIEDGAFSNWLAGLLFRHILFDSYISYQYNGLFDAFLQVLLTQTNIDTYLFP